jgi:hypothetical protein
LSQGQLNSKYSQTSRKKKGAIAVAKLIYKERDDEATLKQIKSLDLKAI